MRCTTELFLSLTFACAVSFGADLKTPDAFSAISNRSERSQALFTEASRVMLHPRCKNCHPNGDSPTQGMEGKVHYPAVTRGTDDHGVVNMRCNTCHQDQNSELARVPGAPKWHLAHRSQAWQGKSVPEVCAQLKDKSRNGGKTLAEIVDHSAHDSLVAWGWAPGTGREPAPGTQAIFGALMQAWVDTGAECPVEGERK